MVDYIIEKFTSDVSSSIWDIVIYVLLVVCKRHDLVGALSFGCFVNSCVCVYFVTLHIVQISFV